MTMTLQETVEAVARLREAWSPVRCDFQLSPCGGCGGPCFQQPCPLCGFYPQGNDRGRWHPPRASREYFATAVDRSGVNRAGGNLATWHTRSLQRALRPFRSRGSGPADAAVEALLDRAQSMRGLTPARAVYDAVAHRGASLRRTPDHAFSPHWDALGDCMALMDHLVPDTRSPTLRTSPDHDGQRDLKARMHDVVSAIHAGDHEAARGVAEACLAELCGLDAAHRVLPHGTLASAMRKLGAIVDAPDDAARPGP